MGVCPRAHSRSPGHNTKFTSQSPFQLFLKCKGPTDASLRDCYEEHTVKAETLESQHQCPLKRSHLQLGAVYSLSALAGQCRVSPHPCDVLTISHSQIFILLFLMKIESNERNGFPSLHLDIYKATRTREQGFWPPCFWQGWSVHAC